MTECAPAAMAFVISPENLIPPSAMMGTPYSFRNLGRLHDGRELRNPYPCNDPCGTNRSGSDPHFHRIDSCFDEIQGPFLGGHIASDELTIRKIFFGIPDASNTSLEWPWAVSMTKTSTPALIRPPFLPPYLFQGRWQPPPEVGREDLYRNWDIFSSSRCL